MFFKNHYVKVGFLTLFCFLTISFFFQMLGKKSTNKKSALVQRKAPDFKVLNLSDDEEKIYTSLDDFKGKPFVLSFWASWCSVCKTEGLFLETKRKALESSGLDKVSFLRVAVSDSFEGAMSVWKRTQESSSELGAKILTAFDETGDLLTDYGLVGIPETFFINRKGFVVYRHKGPLSEEIFDRYYKQISRVEDKSDFALLK